MMKKADGKKTLSTKQFDELLSILKTRFNENPARHEKIAWSDVESRLRTQVDKVWSVFEMERTGGEPDVVARDAESGEVSFVDCAAESPVGRRSFCYDREGLESRKTHKPTGTAMDAAAAMGVDLLDEAQYRFLQETGEFDLKTSSWIHTPEAIRQRGGALFGDRRFGHVFIYHNGASSYYGARGFRCWAKV